MLGARVFRVFISSTFTDTVAERNTLQGCVFEELRAYCALKGYGFQPVDLRWGIGEEASSGQRTMRICLSEIARCQAVSPRPNFVVLLGDRYGWRPLPEVVDAREFDTLRALLDAEEAALADACYHRDDNAVPPVYTLRSKADTKVNWDDAQTHLRPALVTAAGQAGLDEATAAKYWLSATEQEIVEGALTAPHADDHVFCFMRAIERLPADAAAYRDLMPDGSLDTEAAGMLADLKRRLKDRLGDNHVKEYTATWQGDAPSTAHIAELCADMLAALKGVIDQEIERLSELTHLEQERAAHEVFAQERSECFVGRVEYLDRIADYLAVGSDHPLCVFSEGGLGKSALVATAAARAAETHPDAAIVARYIGVTSASADPRSLLADLCAEIGVVYGSTDPVPSTLQELQHELPKRLELATAEKPLIVFLDSLDQLAAGSGATVSWLPSDLPANVALITTTRPGEYLASLRGRLPEDLVCELRPMPPEEGRQLLEDWLAAAKRTLRPSQAAEILGRFATGGSPLYLRLAFEEAKLWPADMTDVFLGSDVPSIIGDLYDRLAAEHGPQLVGHALGFLGCTYERLGLSEDEMLDTLSADDEVWQEFTAGARWEMAVRQLPVVVWSRLYFDLAPYLSPRASEGASLMSFFHKELSDVATARYLGGRAKHMHDVLADVMLSLARGKEAAEREWRGSNHALAELPFHLIGAERWDDVFATLTDFTYLEDKARRVAVVEAKDVEGSEATVYDGVLALVDDYDRALAAFPTESGHEMGGLTTERTDQRFVLEAFGKALAREAHNLRERSDLLWQQMFNRLQWVEGPGVEAVVSGILAPELKERGRPGAGPWLHSLTRPRESGALVRTLTGHTDYVKAAAFSPDGAHIASGSRDGTVKVWAADSGAELATLDHGGEVTAVAYSPDGSRLAAGSTEGTVKIWDAATGAETATFDQTDRVLALAFSPDGSHVVSDSYDSYIDTLKVWDAATGAELVHLRGQRGSVTPFGIPLRRADMAFSRDLTRIVSGIYRDTLTVWDTVRGAELATLTGHADPVWAVAFFPDGTRIVSGSMDNSLKVWDAATGAELATLTGHTGDVQACAVSPDGAWVVSGSDDKTVKVWDVAAAVELGTPSGHTSQVNAVAFSSDGTRVASGSGTVFDSSDNSVKVWDAAIGAELATLRGHKLSVHTVAYSPDGTRIVSGARDWILKVWDVASGKELTTLRGHTNDVNAAAYSPDGTRIVSGSKSSVVPAVTLYGPSSDDTLKVWDAASGAELANLADHTHEVYAVDYSPDGSRIVSGSSDKTLKIWDAGTGEELATLSGHMGRVQAAAYSPDGTRIVSGSADHTLKVWDAATGAELATLFGHTQSVNAVGFSADGSQIASSSDDSTLKVWDAHTTECLATLPCLGPVGGCDYSPHGTRICCGDTSGTVYILELMGSSV